MSRRQPTSLTAQEAVLFSHYSEQNAARLAEAARRRGCQCRPYRDWFTYQRWKALGFQVRRGEKSTRLLTFIPVRKSDEPGGEARIIGKHPWTAFVFCRCQVKAKEQ